MSHPISFISGQLGSYGVASATQKMFGVLSDISTNFQKELSEVKEKQGATSKQSIEEEIISDKSIEDNKETEVEPEEILEGDSLDELEKEEEDPDLTEEDSAKENPFEKEKDQPKEELITEKDEKDSQSNDNQFNETMNRAQMSQDQKSSEESSNRSNNEVTIIQSPLGNRLNSAEGKENSLGKMLDQKIDSLSPKSTSTAQIPIALSQKVAQDLSAIRANGVISSPLVGKVSPEVMNALKSVNPQLAQGMESANLLESETSQVASQAKPTSSTSMSSGSNEKITLQEGEDKAFEQMERMEKRVVEQVKVQIRASVQGNVSSITLKLKPHFLGDLAVEMSIEGSKVSANFVVETQTVKEILQKNIEELKSMLQEQGFEVEEINVTVSDDPHQEDQPGTRFASMEEKKAAQEWIGSFAHLKTGNENGSSNDLSNQVHNQLGNDSEGSERNSDRLLDVVA